MPLSMDFMRVDDIFLIFSGRCSFDRPTCCIYLLSGIITSKICVLSKVVSKVFLLLTYLGIRRLNIRITCPSAFKSGFLTFCGSYLTFIVPLLLSVLIMPAVFFFIILGINRVNARKVWIKTMSAIPAAKSCTGAVACCIVKIFIPARTCQAVYFLLSDIFHIPVK